ncbi:ABC transporter substrate-binding protein [Metasolibacillus meyeri]|uniref:ABC transporter substrate-binding protein n=1 Tax=Metasolibacillus meyeri TaxID=1071052 RepID=A0AAW9NUX3_9BACL|nr:ABC transporter substrate-binding protein [Metasolibacillus meyeri]MEC1179154.1 ABC transporter substrate-binding protein [Metasolibacillus meyeri]
MFQYLLKLYEHFEVGQPSTTSIAELAQIWCCSTRYAKVLVKKCAERGWLEWQTVQGRSKKPTLLLQLTKLDAIYLAFDYYWQQQQFKEAYTLLQQYDVLSHPQVDSWLQQRYGFTNEEERDIFRYPYPNIMLNYDPLNGNSRHDIHLYNQIHEPLFVYCAETERAKPNLVYGYHTTDAKKWTFTLRKNIYFHDGTKLTSEDVIASLKRVCSKELLPKAQLTAISPYHFTIELAQPSTLLPRWLCGYRFSIVPAKWIEAGAQGVPVGCGAFYIAEQNEQHMRLSVFPKYFQQRPWIDDVDIIFTENIHQFGISTLPFAPHITQQKITYQEQGADFILLNATRGPLCEEKYRRALFEAIDAASYCLMEEGEIVATSFLTANSREQQAVAPLSLLDFPYLHIGVQQIRPQANHLREAQILSSFLTAHNIPHAISLMPIGASVHYCVQHYDIFIGGIAIGGDQLLGWLYGLDSDRSPISTFLGSAQVQALLQQATMCEDNKQALQLLYEAEQHLIDAFVLKFLTHRQHVFYVRKDLPFHNIVFDTHGKIDYRKIYREK